MRIKRNFFSIALILCFLILTSAGCGGGGSDDVAPPPPEPISISIGTTSSRVWVGQTLQFSAHVEGDGSHAVAWGVEGAGCTSNACGTIDTSGLYTTPATLTVANIVVRGTSVADPTKSATAPLVLLAPALDRLQGQYVFLVEGYLTNGEIMHMGGVFAADGNGALSGLLDGVLSSSVINQQAFTGDYTLSTENRGHIIVGYPGDSFNFSYVLNAAGDRGYVISFDDSDIRAAGMLLKQNLSAYPSAGDYAFLFRGENGAVGRVHLDSGGNLEGTASLLNGGDWVAYGSQVNGSYESYSNGSGNGTIHFGFGDAHCRVYVIDANNMLWLSLDPQGSGFGRLTGELAKQSGGPFDTSMVNGTYILAMSGVVYQSNFTHSMVGRLALDGSGAISGAYDYNDHGTIELSVPVTTTGGMSTYNVSADGLVDFGLDAKPYHGVLVSPDRALFLTEYAFDHYGFLTGWWERQSEGLFDNGSPAGVSAYGNESFTSNAAPLLQCGVARLDGHGQLNMIEDENSFGQPVADAEATTTYSVSADGRFTAESMVGYEISPTRLVIFNADPQDSAPQLLQAKQ